MAEGQGWIASFRAGGARRRRETEMLMRQHGTLTGMAARRKENLQKDARSSVTGHSEKAASAMMGHLIRDQAALRRMASRSAFLNGEPRSKAHPRDLDRFCRRLGIPEHVGRAYWAQANVMLGRSQQRDPRTAGAVLMKGEPSLAKFRVALAMLVASRYPYLLLASAPRTPDYGMQGDAELVEWLSMFVSVRR